MAITIGSITTAHSSVNDNAPSVAVPAGASVGDLFVLIWHFLGSSTVTWPSGFTDIGVTANESNVAGYAKAAIRVCDGSETGSFTGSTGSYQQWEARCVIVKGASATLDAKSANSTYQYSSTAAFTGASITTTGASRTILFIAGTTAGGNQTATGTVVPPSGFTTDNTVDRGNGMLTTIAHGSQASAGAATYSGSATFGAVSDSRGSDILVLAFTPSGGNSFIGGVSESMTMADTGAGVSAFQAASTQSLSATDSATGSNSSSASASEAINATSAQTAAQGVSGATTESATLADSQTGAGGFSGASSESITVAEAIAPSSTASASAAEAIAASDAQAASITTSADVSETSTASDAMTSSLAVTMAVAEAVTPAESAGGAWSSSSSVAESLTASDTCSPNAIAVGAMAETVAVLDSAAASAAMYASVSEGALLSDQSAAMAAFSALCVEAATLVEVLGTQLAASAGVDELLSVVDGPSVITSMTSSVIELCGLVDAATAFLGAISIGADSPAYWVAPFRSFAVVLPARAEKGSFVKTYADPFVKRSIESVGADIDASHYLGEGVLITSVLGSTVEPATDPALQVSGITVNGAVKTINGVSVQPGQGLQMTIAGGVPRLGKAGRPYTVRIRCTTNRGADVLELTVPVVVDDFPYFS